MLKFTKLLVSLLAIFPFSVSLAQLSLPITFDDTNVTYTMTDFDGGTTTLMANPFSGGINTTPKVLQMVKNAGQVWGGSKLTLSAPLDFSTNNTFKMMVYSPRVGCPVLFKLEEAGGTFVERTTNTTVANAWEELSWNFGGSTSNLYTDLTFIYDLGVMGDGSANFTFYQDEIQFVPGPAPTGLTLPITFDDPNITYTMTDFDGGTTALMANPFSGGINTTSHVLQMIKNAGQPWGGSKLTLSAPLDFSTNNTFKMKVYSPRVGCPVLFKLEQPGVTSTERTATTTVANAWEELSWDFSGATSNIYTDLTFIYDLGVMGDGSANFTFYQDEIQFVSNGSVLSQIDLPVTFESPNVNYTLTDFGGNYTALGADPTNPNNTVAITAKNTGAETWAGTTIGTSAGFANVIPFTITERSMAVRVYSPDAGIPIRLKVEVHGDPTKSVETDAITTTSNAWEYLIFNFNNNAAGTAAFDPTYPYDMASIFFNFGTDGNTAGDKTYYWDDVMFGVNVAVENPFAAQVNLFPNPVANVLNIKLTDNISVNNVSYIITDMTGKKVLAGKMSQPQIEVSSLVNGLYLLQIQTEKGMIHQKFVKQ